MYALELQMGLSDMGDDIYVLPGGERHPVSHQIREPFWQRGNIVCFYEVIGFRHMHLFAVFTETAGVFFRFHNDGVIS